MNNSCDWMSVAVPVTEAIVDLVLAYLYELGAGGIVEHPGRLEAFFPISMSGVEEKIRARLHTLRDQGFAADPDKIAVQQIPNQDWNREWKKKITTVCASADGCWFIPAGSRSLPKRRSA